MDGRNDLSGDHHDLDDRADGIGVLVRGLFRGVDRLHVRAALFTGDSVWVGDNVP